MIFRPKNFNRDDDGKLTTNNLPKKWNTSYSESVVNYLNKLEPLFDKAQEKSEFDFILTLLRFRGIQSAGHDPYENSVETIDALMRMEKQLKGKCSCGSMAILLSRQSLTR
jgi:hypothetical protein